jgi:DNA-binding winged helix-turn-helix (wHTH) protein/tetratricopeptide (TPR) repeat protein
VTQRLFAPFRLDPQNAQLWRGTREVKLRRKTFEVLRFLVDRPGQLVTKAILLDAIWPDVAVSDSMPAVCVKELRKALNDAATKPKFIETVHRRGYRFIGPVVDGPDDNPVKSSVTPQRPVTPPPRPRPIIGRQDELAKLAGWYSDAAEGERRLVFVSGEAGIGKTVFVKSFLDTIDPRVAFLGSGQCVEQYGPGEPYMPILDAFSRLGQKSNGRLVIETLKKFAPTWLAQMPGLQTYGEPIREAGQPLELTKERMLREMIETIESLAAERPLVLFIEDLHWSDVSSLELISAIARRSEPARVLLIGTYRPVETLSGTHSLRLMKQELLVHHYCEELRLKLLQVEDIEKYLSLRFKSTDHRQLVAAARVLHERTDGNPLFILNVLDYLPEDDLFDQPTIDDAESKKSIQGTRLEVPLSIRKMIECNLERLNPREQAVLETASVAGNEFCASAVAAGIEWSEKEVEELCVSLSFREQFVAQTSEIVWPDGSVSAGFRFDHSLYQEVLYGLVPPFHRAQLHRLIAAREEAAYGQRSAELANELAHHYEQGNDKAKAVHYFRLAAERAVLRGAVVEAETHYSRALQLLAQLPETTERAVQELILQMELGKVLWSSKSWTHQEADRAYTRALKLAEELGETTQIVRILTGLVISALGAGKSKLACELAERMLVEAEHSGDDTSRYVAHCLLGQTLIMEARYPEAQNHLATARGYYTKSNRTEVLLFEIDAVGCAAIVDLLLGFAERAGERIGVLRRWHSNDDQTAGLAHMWGGEFCRVLRDTQGLLSHAQALRSLALKMPVWGGFAEHYTGEVLVEKGSWAEGALCLRRALALYKEAGYAGGTVFAAKLAEVKILSHEQRFEDALAIVSEVIAEGVKHLSCPSLLQRANLLAQENANVLAIENAYRSAMECARSQGAKYFELEAATSCARWLKSQGRIAEAQVLLAQNYSWFTEGFDTASLKDAKALIDELSR